MFENGIQMSPAKEKLVINWNVLYLEVPKFVRVLIE